MILPGSAFFPCHIFLGSIIREVFLVFLRELILLLKEQVLNLVNIILLRMLLIGIIF